jgi:hypothetical protein
MIKIKVKALTLNAFKGIQAHYKDCNKLSNRIKLKSFGVEQTLLTEENSLEICYTNLLTKLKDKMHQNEFKAIFEKDKRNEFNKQINDFMHKQHVKKEEYEVIFQDD